MGCQDFLGAIFRTGVDARLSQGPYVPPLPSNIFNTGPHLEALRPHCLPTTLVSTGLGGGAGGGGQRL